MSASEDNLAGEAWRLMFGYLMQSGPDRARTLGARGLTPNDARALWHLDDGQGRPIGSLARDWNCDPSNATFIVDRLERAGLAERRPDPDDRRVKLVFLTEAGARTKAEVMAEHLRPPASLATLSKTELADLVALLRKLPQAGS